MDARATRPRSVRRPVTRAGPRVPSMIPDFYCPRCGAPLSRPGRGGQFRSDHFRCPRCKETFDVADALERPPRRRLYWALGGAAAGVVLIALWLLLRG